MKRDTVNDDDDDDDDDDGLGWAYAISIDPSARLLPLRVARLGVHVIVLMG